MMHRSTWLSALALTVSVAATADCQVPAITHQLTSVPNDVRFELIQSGIVARSIYRLDKFHGGTEQLVIREDGSLTWEDIPRNAHPDGEPQRPEEPNYQLFVSGLANLHTYLINVNNGATWQLVLTPESRRVWDPIQ